MTETEAAARTEEASLTAETPRAEPSAPELPEPPRRKGKRRKKKRLWPWLLLLLAAVDLLAAPVMLNRLRGGSIAQTVYTTEAVQPRTIVKTLTGSGTLKPADAYTVTTLVTGEVLSADFAEGDVVEKDTVLYEVDSADAANSIEQARRSVEQAEITLDQSRRSLAQSQRSYNDAASGQYVRTRAAGVLRSLSVGVGDSVSAGQTVATVRDSAVMRLTVPFPADDAARFYPGQWAEVTLDGSFEVLSGTVAEVSALETVDTGNMIHRDVTVEVWNPGALTDSQSATVIIDGAGCAAPGVFAYRSETAVTAGASGTVSALLCAEGDWVEAEQAVLTLGGTAANSTLSAADSLQNAQGSVRNAELSLENARLSLENAEGQLENYHIKSPIYGTIVEKNYKAGDTVEAGRQLCTIYDLSYLEMTLNVDELDINAVAVGQKARVTAEAAEGLSYEGRVVRISVAGSTAGGITTYPVTVRIDRTEGLLPGMNADAEIVVARAEEALSVPNAAVSRGGLVLITADSPSASRAATETEAPEGFVYVTVSTGISDDDYVEITGGLTREDTVAWLPPAYTGGSFMEQMMQQRNQAMAERGGFGP